MTESHRDSTWPIIIHVPHSSTFIPEQFRTQFTCSSDRIDEIHEALVDHDTQLMVPEGIESVVFPLSRLVLDVERFWDRAIEPMECIGMGAIYRVDHDKRPIRTPLSETQIAELETIYNKHHSKLAMAVNSALSSFERCLIIDLHSYPHQRQPYEQSTGARPQLCIGTDAFHTSKQLIELTKTISESHGFEVDLNTPFEGTIVPLERYRHDDRVHSVMLEWRRDIYRTGGLSDHDRLTEIRRVVHQVCVGWIGLIAHELGPV